MGEHVADRLPQLPDLMVCDNLVPAYTKSFTGRPEGATAGDAHHQFAKWCQRGDVAFLGGIPLGSREAPDVSGPAYEQLRTFSHLRVLQVEEVPEDQYRIEIVKMGTAFTVPKATLDGYGIPTILTS
jgi:hypothetical protein